MPLLSIFGKKKPETIKGKGHIPVERVRELSSKGFTEPEIIDMLRKEGYSAEEIEKAITEALKEKVEKEEKKEMKLPTIEDLNKPKVEEKFEVPEEVPVEYYNAPSEEYIEAYVNTRISEIEDKIKKIEARYHEILNRFQEMNKVIAEINKRGKEDFDKLLDGFEDVKKSISELGVKVSAMEKALKETLPALIESVRALSLIINELKK